MSRRIPEPKTLTLMLTLIVFIIMVITMVLTGFVGFLLYKVGLLTAVELTASVIYQPILVLMILSIAIGTSLSIIMNKVPLKPIRQIIDATNKLARGNFDVRINLSYPNELVELSKSFNRMAEELGSIEMLRSDFVNNFSHEFKTPIVSLQGFAKVLKNKDLSTDERDEYLDIIISEADRLASLATNVLNLSQVENLKIVTENKPFDLSEQIRRSILVLEAKWSEKKLDMQIDIEDVVFNGNEDLLNQLWLNLVDNAVKFSPHNGEIEIKLNEVEDYVIFEICNNGFTLNEEAKKHIFDKFYQGDTSHASDGNGIGLAVVNKIVSLYNGSITVESEEAIGTSFVVTLPNSK